MESLYILDKLIAVIERGYTVKFSQAEPGVLLLEIDGKEDSYAVEYKYTNRADDKELNDLMHHARVTKVTIN